MRTSLRQRVERSVVCGVERNAVRETVCMAAQLVARSTLVYLGAVNAGSVALFGYDKTQAQNGGWRVSEADLCRSALLGGWIGGLLAMQVFRHKTQKKVQRHCFLKVVCKIVLRSAGSDQLLDRKVDTHGLFSLNCAIICLQLLVIHREKCISTLLLCPQSFQQKYVAAVAKNAAAGGAALLFLGRSGAFRSALVQETRALYTALYRSFSRRPPGNSQNYGPGQGGNRPPRNWRRNLPR